MSQLGFQLGVVVCRSRCWDDLEINNHEARVAIALNQNIEEGVDTRFVDANFFSHAMEDLE